VEPLQNLFKQFKDDRRYLNNVSKKTLLGYEHAWRVFGPYLKDIDSETEVKPAVKQAIIDIQSSTSNKDARKRKREEGSRPITDGSINTYLTVINALLSWAHLEEKVDRLIKMPKLKTLKKVREGLKPEEVQAFIDFKPRGANEVRIKTMSLIALDCGLRLKEVRSLKEEDLDLDNNLLKVYSGKGKKQRMVPFSDELRKALYKYMRDNRDLMTDGYLFGTSGRKLYSQRNASRDFKALVDKLGVPHLTFHQFPLTIRI
jgi:integrase/recombinase XerD